jgi:hypothetical protein|tara:strand:- start:6074 stop:6316 length:243 start_codon:yes stop_codon:yes gene_type:complete
MAEIVYNVHRVFCDPFQCEREDWWLTCRVEDVESGEMFTDDIPFEDFDSAYKFKSMFNESIEAVRITIPYNSYQEGFYHA